ncbi:MAG: hypothetical protein ACK56I_27835, partial [bacterium]
IGPRRRIGQLACAGVMLEGDAVLQRTAPVGPIVGKKSGRKRQGGGESEVEAWLHAKKGGAGRSKGRPNRQRVFHPVLTGGTPSGKKGKSWAGQNEPRGGPLSTGAGLDEQFLSEKGRKQKGREWNPALLVV